MDCIDDLMQFYRSRAEPCVGVSDSHLAHILPTLVEVVRPRTLIVLRDIGEVTQSLEARGLSSRHCIAALHNIGAVLGNPLVRTIEYADLSNSSMLAEAFRWLMPDVPVSIAAIEKLQNVSIEADLTANRQIWAANESRRDVIRSGQPYISAKSVSRTVG
jgi:hypothetical protein